ncbi:NfeD family protein [Granulicoccus phenolivorans]|uniref:NfeD family protein n=1 Tax=Granulicoccus phenolivorans TaxID=266854 RepID=UPI0004199DE9|nr:NfeD family protein [Granulicoccus phenolivorans]
MFDWLGANPWALWLFLSVALAVAESMNGDFFLLMVAVGALAGMVVAIFLPGVVLIQVLVAIVVALLTVFLLRPTLMKRVRNSPGYRSSLDKILGAEGRTRTEITAAGGEVLINGDVWSARPYEPDAVIPAGVLVDVYERDGVTLLVQPQRRELDEGGFPTVNP